MDSLHRSGQLVPYTVNGLAFARKADVRAAADTIREGTPLGEDVSGTDRDFVLALLAFHEEAEDKMRDGVSRLTTMRNAFGTVSFAITRTDGTSDDFSVGTCVRGLSKD